MQSQDRRLLLSRDGLISRHHWRASVPLRPSVSRCPPPSPRASFARLHQAGQHATACGASHRDDTPILRLPLHEHHPFARAPDPPRAATAMTKKSDSAGLASRWGPLRGPAGRESAAGARAPAPARGASGRTSRWLRDASPAAAPHGTVRTERARTRRSRRAPPPPDSRGIGRIALSTPALLVERLDARGVRRHAVHRRSRFSAAVAKARVVRPGPSPSPSIAFYVVAAAMAMTGWIDRERGTSSDLRGTWRSSTPTSPATNASTRAAPRTAQASARSTATHPPLPDVRPRCVPWPTDCAALQRSKRAGTVQRLR